MLISKEKNLGKGVFLLKIIKCRSIERGIFANHAVCLKILCLLFLCQNMLLNHYILYLVSCGDLGIFVWEDISEILTHSRTANCCLKKIEEH